MKKLITVVLILISIRSMAQYHIRVECFGEKEYDPDYQNYQVRFTNDNWKTSKPLMDSFDTFPNDPASEPTFQEALFTMLRTSKRDAINFACNFKTLYSCLKYNQQKLDKYHKFILDRKKRIYPKPKILKHKQNCCTITQVY